MAIVGRGGKLEALTAEEEADLPRFREEWLQRGLCTEPADRAEVERGMELVYRSIGREPPRLRIWMDSPLGGCYAAAVLLEMAPPAVPPGEQLWEQLGEQLREQLGEQLWEQLGEQLREQLYAGLYGQHDINWVAWLEFGRRIGVKYQPQQESGLGGLRMLAGGGWWWPYEGFVILTDRPSVVARDVQGRLHRTDALVDEDTDALGFPRRLHRVVIPGDEDLVMVEVTNSTPEPDGHRKSYMLRVAPALRTCQGAIASTWRYPDGSRVFAEGRDYQLAAES